MTPLRRQLLTLLESPNVLAVVRNLYGYDVTSSAQDVVNGLAIRGNLRNAYRDALVAQTAEQVIIAARQVTPKVFRTTEKPRKLSKAEITQQVNAKKWGWK